MTPTELTYSNNLKIKFIKDQIKIYESTNKNNFNITWWDSKAIESLEKRILMYK